MEQRRYTRKDLRKPDEFISLTMRALKIAQENLKRLLIILGISFFIVVAFWAWTSWRNNKAANATRLLSKALETYSQPINNEETRDISISDNSVSPYKNRTEKYKALDQELTKAIEVSRGELESLALLVQAGVHFDQQKYDDAIKKYQQFIDENGEEPFRRLAIEGLIYSYEAKKKWDDALKYIKELNQEGENQWVSQYHQARIFIHQNRKKEAVVLFKQIVDKAKDSDIVNQARNQLALIENS